MAEDESAAERKLDTLSTVSLPERLLMTHSRSSSSSGSRSSEDKLMNDDVTINGLNNNHPSRIHTIELDSKPPTQHTIEILRDALTQEEFALQAGLTSDSDSQQNLARKLRAYNSDNCSPCQVIQSVFPIVEWLPKYSLKKNLIHDLIAGLTISVLHIPQGIAYSLLAGLGPVHGLYVSFFPTLIYLLMGTSRHVSIGTFAIASIMLSSIATKHGNGNGKPLLESALNLTEDNMTMSENLEAAGPTNLEVLTAVCLLCGLIQISMGILRLGSLSLILSEHLVSSFSTALAFYVATSQLTYILGFESLPRAKSGPLKLIRSWIILVDNFHRINYYSVGYSALMITILVVFKELIDPKLKKRNSLPVPIDLLLVVFSILMSWLFKFQDNFAINVVRTVPTGLPTPTVPRFDLMPSLFFDSIILSIVCFAVTLSLGKIFAKKHKYTIRPNQELLALGSANLFSSFFLAFPASGALSRSTIQEKTGGKTQITGLVSAAIILLVLLLLAPYLYHLPKCTLSCIILVALKAMFVQLADFAEFWRISKLDGTVWLVTFLSVILLDIDLGLIAGICISVIVLLIRLAMPHLSFLGQFGETEIYAENDLYSNLKSHPGVHILRFTSPLFYLNVEIFKQNALTCVTGTKRMRSKEADRQTLILDLAGVSFIDKAGIDTLVDVVRTLQKNRTETSIAQCPPPVVKSLKRANFVDRVQHQHYPCRLYPTIHDAMLESC